MANKRHLSILKGKGGVRAWNKWRSEHREIIPDLSWADLMGVNLSGADLGRADLRVADLSVANLRIANLDGADLRRADLDWADLNGAGLREAALEVASLQAADLVGANLTNSTMGATRLGAVDLSGVKGLETVKHSGPSTIGIDTIYRSNGKIPEVFLRGAGVPDNFIEYMKSLAGIVTAIEYDSCFISYSSKNEDFARRLHTDLQAEHIRCWFAPEDLKIGEKFRPKIDEAIRLYDKLLLVLSENSIHSPWVEKEVETAFEKERKQRGKTVLFPIRLDDAVMKTDQAWAADIRCTRHIGDFSHWKNHDEYKKTFDRLLRDLKAEEKNPAQG